MRLGLGLRLRLGLRLGLGLGLGLESGLGLERRYGTLKRRALRLPRAISAGICRNHSAAVTTMPIMADITIDSPMAFCTSSLLPLACAAATRGVRIVGIVEVTMEHVEYTWLAAD